jgi:hypothetical protein
MTGLPAELGTEIYLRLGQRPVVGVGQFHHRQACEIWNQPVSIHAGVRYWAEPDTGAHDFGARLNIIFLFPTAK